MLVARATSDVIRLIAPEVILGLPYSAEEVSDGSAFDVSDAPAADGGKKPATRARRKPLGKAPVEEPALPGEAPSGEPVDAEVVDAADVDAVLADRDEELAEAAAVFAEEPDLDWGDES